MGCCGSKSKPLRHEVNGHRSGAPNTGGINVPQQPSAAQQKSPASQAHRPQPPPPQPRPPPSSQPPAPSPQKPATQSPKPAAQPQESILGKPFEDIKQFYTFGKELGRGQFGITYLCTEKSTGNTYACKSILKRKLVSKNDKDDMRREIQILQHLSGQPNIVEFKGAYEDRYNVHVVMELCSGGELFDRIIAQGHYSERAAAAICRQIVNVVHNCHFMGVMHRDLKPENFLLSSRHEGAMLKATDFGLSVFIEEGEFSITLFLLFFFNFKYIGYCFLIFQRNVVWPV